MENGKLTYRILTSVAFALLALNLIEITLLELFGVFSKPSRIDVWLIGGSILFSLIGIILLKKSSLSFIKKSLIYLVIIVILTLPSIYRSLTPQISKYILSWESSHCVSTGTRSHGTNGVPEYKCDNGDYIYYEGDGSDGKRLFKGGRSKVHFPYWLIY